MHGNLEKNSKNEDLVFKWFFSGIAPSKRMFFCFEKVKG